MHQLETEQKMSPLIKMQIKNPDLAATLKLWFGKDFQQFLNHGTKQIIISEGKGPFRVVRHDGKMKVFCPADFLETSISLFNQILHKTAWKLGCQSGPFVLQQSHTLTLYSNARQELVQNDALETTRCRFLLRVDDFPSIHENSAHFFKFHKLASEFKIPYLLGVTPFLDRGKGPEPLTSRELEILRQCSREGAVLALHGFTHKNRYSKYNSELMGMSSAELEEKIQEALRYFRSQQLEPRIFIAPFNTYDPDTVYVITKYFPVLCGGPESSIGIGNRIGPSFLNGSLYAPSYGGVYDLTAKELPKLQLMANRAPDFILPITIHWTNEYKNGFETFRILCELIKGTILSWNALIDLREQAIKE